MKRDSKKSHIRYPRSNFQACAEYRLLVYPLVFLFYAVVCWTAFAESEPSEVACLDCHDKNAEEVAIVTVETIDKSVHEGTDCIECHADITKLKDADSHEKAEAVDCGECHDEVVEIYKRHGRLETGRDNDTPACANCHGTHETLSMDDEKSSTHPANLPKTCGNCHDNPELTKEHAFLPKEPIATYETSIHGVARAEGNQEAATCRDCHFPDETAHRILSPGNPQAGTNHFAIPKTCGNCHTEEAEAYRTGIHGQLTERGDTNSPVCTDCHGEHRIYASSDARSSVFPAKLAEATCAPCHESARLSEKYGLPPGETAHFRDSFHVSMSSAGDTSVANCASCHRAHKILPPSDPSSSLHPSQIRETCQECHENITQDLASIRLHDIRNSAQKGWPYFFTILYTLLISITVGAMILYILLDYGRQVINMAKKRQIRRMDGWSLLQHTMLAISFAALVVTGFALHYPNSWWAQLLFGREGGFPLRSLLHRFAGVLLALTSLMHIAYLKSRRGFSFFKYMIPGKTDFLQAVQMVKYNLGFTKETPRFGKFTFGEKFEYWAVIWGTAIMVVTGLFLVFDNYLIRYLPRVFFDVMRVIHFYEAWLATLSILIWHLYGTVFNPRIYPMNPSWITGKMPQEQYREEHPDDCP